MRCLKLRLTLVCAALSLSSCAHAPPPTDSYCLNYDEVIKEKGDGDIKAKPSVKRRILGNELKYRGLCPKE
jgi:hypothetical protein